MPETTKIVFLNLENYVPFEEESQNFLLRLPILRCGLPIEYRDIAHQRDLKTQGRKAAEKRALAVIHEFQPNLIFYSHTWRYGDLSPHFFAAARQTGAKIVSCIWDSFPYPATSELALFANSDCLLIADSLNAYLRWRVLAAMTQSKRAVGLIMGLYHYADEVQLADEVQRVGKTRDVTIVGSLFGERLQLAEFLRPRLAAEGVTLHTLGGVYNESAKERGFRETWLNWHDYARVIRESKICLNSQNDPARMQIKGKIFEIIGRGTLCLTDANVETVRMFPPDVLPLYHSKEDCLEKIIYFLAHEEERQIRERQAMDWMGRNFNPAAFYSALISYLVNDNGEIPSHAFLDNEFAVLMREHRMLLPALANLVSAQVEILARDNSFPSSAPVK